MSLTKSARDYHERFFQEGDHRLHETDPEYMTNFENFAYDEVVNEPNASLDDHTRFMSILAILLGCQGVDEFAVMVPAAIRAGLTPVQVKEIVYQATDYLGMGRVLPFLTKTNEIFESMGISLPLEEQGTVAYEERTEKGEQAQVDIFGGHMKGFANSGPEDVRHINRFLSANCFGDYYTRNGLDYRQRELITFCFLYAQGGCEPQLKSHIGANFHLGNDRKLLIAIISNGIPYIGYPRTLNALRCINEVAEGK